LRLDFADSRASSDVKGKGKAVEEKPVEPREEELEDDEDDEDMDDAEEDDDEVTFSN
jgi:hypothetical protein